ncbi:MAG: hypothetical protein V2A53_07990 [bacterium]
MTNPYLKFRKQVKASLDKYTKEIKGFRDNLLFAPTGILSAEFSIPVSLPYWLSEIFELGTEKDRVCSVLSIGNLYGVSYIRSIGQSEGIGGFFLFKFIKGYQKIFPSDSRFWDYIEGYIKETIRYFDFYRQDFKKRKTLLKEAIEISGNRYALQKCCSSAFCLLGKGESLHTPMEEMMENFSKGLSLRNAAREWKEDLLHKRATFPLIKLHLIESKESAEDTLFLEGIIEETLKHSVYYFNLALLVAKKLGLTLFASFLEHTVLLIESTVKELEAIRKNEY